MKKLNFKILCLFLICSSSVFAHQPKRQMRAVWITTAFNIDWPSSNNLTTEAQKRELVDMLDALQELNFNTVVFQARAASDAFFVSSKEPWSHWLTGSQGQAPSPFYDPLKFLIQEARARNMAVHVWLNPYRVASRARIDFAENHPFNTKKHLIREYDGQFFFDPGFDETREYLNRLVAEIVKRYDINAIHFDDYFYPYKVAGLDFPDYETFRKNPRGFAEDQKAEWRRNNITLLISEVQQTIKSIKPWVEFGISPFGVWRSKDRDPRGSATVGALTNYDDLYADILKWLERGYIDYVVPQLYWEIGHSIADYRVLIDWWSNNTFGRNLYIGMFASGLGRRDSRRAWRRGNELARKLELNRQFPQQQGVFFFSARPLLRNPQRILDYLRNDFFRYPALVPINPNIDGSPSAPPSELKLLRDGDNAIITWQKVVDTGGQQVAFYVVYAFEGNTIGDIENPANIVAKTATNFLDISEFSSNLTGKYTFTVTSVNRFKHESAVLEYVVVEF